MASAPGGTVISALRESLIHFWNTNEGPAEYFWLHRLFSKIATSGDDRIREAFDHRTAVAADPFHCLYDKVDLGPDSEENNLSKIWYFQVALKLARTQPSDLPMFKIKSCPAYFQKKVFQYLHVHYGID